MLTLRPATMTDATLLFLWRNDPSTRAASHSTGEIDFDSHCNWLDRSLQMPSRRLLIAEIGGAPVGTVRADSSAGATELSWTVAPDRRGTGVGKSMVAAAAAIMPGPIRAEIKAGNAASCRIAESVGMRLVREVGGVLHYQSTI